MWHRLAKGYGDIEVLKHLGKIDKTGRTIR